MSKKPTYTEEHLYSGSGPNEVPRARDIQQDNLNDCYFVGPLGSLADQQPQRIKDAIRYNPETGNFTVTMYKDNAGKAEAVQIEVTQAELKDNVNRGGGSTVDNGAGKTPMWPMVYETAFAKMHDTNPSDGLTEGYRNIEFGYSSASMFTLTGKQGTDIFVGDIKTPEAAEAAYKQVSDALAAKQPVVLDTRVETTGQDNLLDAHTYIVNRIYKDEKGEAMVELRNPLGHNNDGEGKDSNSATVNVKLSELISTEGFLRFSIGPTPDFKVQQTTTGAAPEQASPADSPAKNTNSPSPASAEPGSGSTAAARVNEPYVDNLLQHLRDGTLNREAMTGSAPSSDYQQFRAQGKAEFEQVEAQRVGALAAQTVTQENPVMERSPAPRALA